MLHKVYEIVDSHKMVIENKWYKISKKFPIIWEDVKTKGTIEIKMYSGSLGNNWRFWWSWTWIDKELWFEMCGIFL